MERGPNSAPQLAPQPTTWGPSNSTDKDVAAAHRALDEKSEEEIHTLAIDIGGSGIKALVLDHKGEGKAEHRLRVDTPSPASQEKVIEAITELVTPLSGSYDRVSVGFPGVVRNGKILTAANLEKDWIGVNLQDELVKRLKKPVKVGNDADIQGLGVIEGKGVELVLTLGTGLGSGLFINGVLVPNLELAHTPFKNNMSYEEHLGRRAQKKFGKKKWQKNLQEALQTLDALFNPDTFYIGGGEAKKVDVEKLPKNVKIVQNIAGLLGGIYLWKDPSSRPSHPSHLPPPPTPTGPEGTQSKPVSAKSPTLLHPVSKL